MTSDARHRHRSYLLRLWQAGTEDAPEWRFLLEDVRTRERLGFVDLASLTAFLEARLREVQQSNLPTDVEGESGI